MMAVNGAMAGQDFYPGSIPWAAAAPYYQFPYAAAPYPQMMDMSLGGKKGDGT